MREATMTDVSHSDIDKATAVLRKIADENGIGVLFGNDDTRGLERLGDSPTTMASLVRGHDDVLTAVTMSPAATPNVIEPLMHEMAHAVLGFTDSVEEEWNVCHLVIKWAGRLPESMGPGVAEDSQMFLDELDYDTAV